MKRGHLVLIFAIGVSGCVSHRSSQTIDVFSGLAGEWDEAGPESCKKPHVISFDDEKNTMFLAYPEMGWATESDSRKVFRYEILSIGQSMFRTKLENESRQDDEGKPVVWHMVLVDDNTYCWGRDDWPQGACTPLRTRCGI